MPVSVVSRIRLGVPVSVFYSVDMQGLKCHAFSAGVMSTERKMEDKKQKNTYIVYVGTESAARFNCINICIYTQGFTQS